MQRENSENDDGRERRLANLRPFQKGQSGNPKGRPKDAILTKEIRSQLNDVRDDGKTNAQAIVESMIERAVKGDVRAADLIFNRIEGKPLQSVDLDLSVNTDWQMTLESFDISEAEMINEVRGLLTEFYNRDSDESGE